MDLEVTGVMRVGSSEVLLVRLKLRRRRRLEVLLWLLETVRLVILVG